MINKIIQLEERIVLDAAGTVIFVDINATGNNDGSSWQNAYDNLQDALSQAGSTAAAEQIRIADGTYFPGSSRSDTFIIPNKTTLVGGFGGTTVLSGEIGSALVTDNITTVLTVGTDVTATLKNLTVSRGYNDVSGLGGGLYAINADSLSLSKMTFSNNFAKLFGGGAYIEGLDSIVVTDSQFMDNSVTIFNNRFNSFYAGGGIYTVNNDSVLIKGSTFTGNSATYGGAIAGGSPTISLGGGPTIPGVEDQAVNVIGNTFKNNHAQIGGAYHGFYENVVKIESNKFTDNTSLRYGGALQMTDATLATIRNNVFDHNSIPIGAFNPTVKVGGAVSIELGQMNIVENNIFKDNFIDNINFSQGGALWFDNENRTDGGDLVIKNNLFSNNKASASGDLATFGGAIGHGFGEGGSHTITGNIFLNNEAVEGYGGAISSFLIDNATYANNLFIGNKAAIGGAMDVGLVIQLNMSRNIFTKNHATLTGGAIQLEANTNVNISRNVFTGNKAGVSGAAIADGGDPLMIIGPSEFLNITSNVFSNNSAPDNSTLWFSGGETTINGIPITNPTAIINALVDQNTNLDDDEIIID